MFVVASLVSFVLLATEIAANPVITRDSSGVSLSITKKLSSNGTTNVIQADRTRLSKYTSQSNTTNLFSSPNLPLSDNTFSYVATVGIGNPVTNYHLVVDTASANTWVGAGQAYQATQSSLKTNDSVKVNYGSSYFEGTEYLDTLTFAPDAVITQQPIGVASQSNGFQPYDGVLAIGPNVLSLGSLNPDGTTAIPTVTDNLFNQKIIQNNFVAIALEPTTSASEMNGALMFGSIDTTKIIENPNSFPLTNTTPSIDYWGVDASFVYGSTPLMDITGSGFVDSALALIYLAPDAFARYVQATGAQLDPTTGFLTVNESQYRQLQPLFFVIGGESYEITRNAQIWPRVVNSAIGGSSDSIYLVVQTLGQPIAGLDFILGNAFMQRYYVVLDSAGQHLGLARTPFTHAQTN